jgi:hypothetical protein
MLFDLRSRGRRRTVQAVYLGLAILLGGGLVLFGVGTGNGLGGLFDAFKNGGSNGAQTQAVSAQEKAALLATKQHPSDPSAWASLVQARWDSAGQGSNYNSTTGTFDAAGQKELTGATQAWEQYLKLTNKPDPNVAILAARAYTGISNYGGAANAWELEASADPTVPKFYICLAATAYAAGQTRKGDLATARALSLTPTADKSATKTSLQAAKSSTTTAQQLAQSC